jgi:hypothetical protein
MKNLLLVVILLASTAFAADQSKKITSKSEESEGSGTVINVTVSLSDDSNYSYYIEVGKPKPQDAAVRSWQVGNTIVVTHLNDRNQLPCGYLSDLLTNTDKQAPYRDACLSWK